MDRLLYRKHDSLGEKTLLLPLYLASLPYGWGVSMRTFLYSSGLLKQRRLPCPVISIGNITVGGTGKTPLVIKMARKLGEKGISIAILSRGYRRKKARDPLVTDGERILLHPEESGDEAYLIAHRLKGIPVLVGKDRFKNGLMALQKVKIQGFLLDDGFQHLSLYRDLNILLIDSLTGFGNGYLLPRGILREPLSALRRADLFVLTKVKDKRDSLSLESKLKEIHPRVEIFHSHYEPIEFVDPYGEIKELSFMKGKRVFAFSGIARPETFSSLLEEVGVEIKGELTFPDHHFYSPSDLERIRREAKGVDFLVTTEKDMVKLTNSHLNALPFVALRIDVKIWEEEEFYRRVLEIF
jgi:tetraacyldisaccharide 4'-kinase